MINQAPVGSFMANLPHRLNILEFFSTGSEAILGLPLGRRQVFYQHR